MATTEQIKEARTLLESKWDSEGICGSCGWHALLYEHNVSDDEIEEALDNDGGWLFLTCVSKDDDDSYSHRGIEIMIGRVTTNRQYTESKKE